jgi:hypothetical protein
MRERDGRLIGGARELAQVLENQVKREPERFAALVGRFPNATHPLYFDAVLRGLSQTRVHQNVAAEVCRRVHRLSGRPCGRDVVHLIETMDPLTIPKDILDIAAWYATEDRDPEHELWRTESWSGKPYYGGDIFTAGLNSVRGGAAIAIAHLLFQNRAFLSHLRPTLEKMVSDPSIAVRACVAAVLMSVLRHDRDFAVRLLLDLVQTEDVLLATRDIERFLDYGLQTHYSQLKPVMERMLHSDRSEVRRAGARRAAIISLRREEAAGLAEQCLRGDDNQRLGAAEVYSANLSASAFRERCSIMLKKLFTDADVSVRREAASCFLQLSGEDVAELGDLIESFVASPAYVTDSFPLIHALQETFARLPDTTLLVCQHFIENTGAEVGNIQTGAAMGASTVAKLLVRVYAQSEDEAFKSRCLDLIDRLVELGAFGLGDALATFER